MKPSEKWKSNKWRVDLRTFTLDFIKEHFTKGVCETSVGKIYAIDYRTDTQIPTDKHHISPIVISFGRFRDEEGNSYLRGVNLLYLKESQMLEILDATWKNKDLKLPHKISRMIELHEEAIKIYPYCFKNFEERRIIDIHEIQEDLWGMIPLLKMHLLGNFNAEALNEDFQVENKKKPKDTRKKKTKEIKNPELGEVIEEDLINMNFNEEEIQDI